MVVLLLAKIKRTLHFQNHSEFSLRIYRKNIPLNLEVLSKIKKAYLIMSRADINVCSFSLNITSNLFITI